MLLEEASLISDSGGKVRAALKPILGRQRILALLEGVARKGSWQGKLLPVRMNGETGLLLMKEGRVSMAVCFEWEPGKYKIARIYMVLNPDKLKKLQKVSQNRPEDCLYLRK